MTCSLRLLRQDSRRVQCAANVTYGCEPGDGVWIAGGCRGLFTLTDSNVTFVLNSGGTSSLIDGDSEWPHDCFRRHAPARSACFARPQHTVRPVKLAVSLVYATPAMVEEARREWLTTDNFVAIGDASHPRHHIVYAPDQEHVGGIAWGTAINHKADNRPLQAVRIANDTLDFDWLVVGDADTIFELRRLSLLLSKFARDDAGADYFGYLHPPGLRRPCAHLRICRDGDNRSLDWTVGPRVWPYGGSGYVVSRRLLRRIPRASWAECERKLVSWGGDVRVAKCLYQHTGTILSHLPGLGTSLSRHRSKARTWLTVMKWESTMLESYLKELATSHRG